MMIEPSEKNNKEKWDNTKLGVFFGLVGPLVGILAFRFFKYSFLTWQEYFVLLFDGNYDPSHRVLTSALTVSLVINAALFTLFINTDRDLTAKGIFIITLFYAVVSLILKFAF